MQSSQPWNKGQNVTMSMCKNAWWKGHSQTPLSDAPLQDNRQQAQTEIEGILLKHEPFLQ